ERGLDDERIGHQTERRKLEIARERTVEAAQMDKAIELYKKSLDESAAAVEADIARARVAEAAEKVKTAQQTEEATRRRSVDVVIAEKQAEEKRIAAEADRIRSAVEAEAQKLINEAENILTDGARHSLFRRKMLEHVEGIVSASVKPLEKINDIRIMQLGGAGTEGLGWSNGAEGGPTVNGRGPSGSPTDEVINSALRYRVQAPMVDSLLSDIGIDGSNLAKQSGLLREASDLQRIETEQRRASKEKAADEKAALPPAKAKRANGRRANDKDQA
ncbi:MAG: flotillin domain-containing protein, partial [Pseudomonadota bacterium]